MLYLFLFLFFLFNALNPYLIMQTIPTVPLLDT